MGKRWGNALGGYLTQPRLPNGKFASAGGGLAIAKRSNDLHKKAKKRHGGFVPYARKGVGHSTVGINSGISVTKNRRISAGFYIRTETKGGQKRAGRIAKAQEFAQLAVASRMPRGFGLGKKNETGERTLGGNLKRVKRAQANALYKTVGKEQKVGQYTYRRVGTDRNALPTVIIRMNSPRRKKKGSENKSIKSIAAYNANSVTGKRTYDWTQKPSKKNTRPQRRNAAAAGRRVG